MKLQTWVCAVAMIGTAAACKKKDADKKAEPVAKTADAGADPKKAPPPAAIDAAPAAPPPATGEMTGAEEAARYAECFGFYNDRKWDDYKACFTADAESQDVDEDKEHGVDLIVQDAKDSVTGFSDAHVDVQLTVVGDNHVVGIVLLTGTNDGDLPTRSGPTIPATHKKMGFLYGYVLDFDPKTRLATGAYSFVDPTGLLGQLELAPFAHRAAMTAPIAEHGTVAVTEGSDVEKANLAALVASTDAFNKHDQAAYEATRADGFVLYDSSTPRDVTKDEQLAGVEMLWAEFSDLKNNVGGAIAAGDYVASFGELTGTNDGDLTMAKQKATGKTFKGVYLVVGHYVNGKVDKAWRFTNGTTILTQLGLTK